MNTIKLNYSTLQLEPELEPEAVRYSYSCASFLPRSISTLMSTGTASHTMNTRKKNEYRMLPVTSEMTPTTSGPMNELDYKIE